MWMEQTEVNFREGEMEEPLMRLVNFHKHMEDQLKSRKTSKEVIAELKQMEMDVERIRVCNSYRECVTQLKGPEDLGELAKQHIETQNERILGISGSILQFMIVQDNAQQIYDSSLQHKRDLETKYDKVNYYALFDVLKWCLDKGAHPTIDQIHEISLLTVEECTTHEALLATVQVLKQLIGACESHENTDRVDKIYLNPMQCLWSVGEKLRTVVGEVIRACYNCQTCKESGSVINMLVYLSESDCEEDIKTYFKEADKLLKKDTADPPVTKWVKENGKCIKEPFPSEKSEEEIEQENELRWTMIKRNDNWLRRTVLHLIVIFCHDEKVLRAIPKELIDGQINQKDLNGCTPMDLACLHNNKSAITILRPYVSPNSLGKDTGYSELNLDTKYKNTSSKIFEHSSVFEQMKNMLVLKVDECIQIEDDFENLFTKMLREYEDLNAEIVMGGSVMEKLKVGRWDEFDLQILLNMKDRPYFVGQNEDGDDEYESFACLRLHEDFVKGMPKIDEKMKISLQFASFHNPWKFIQKGNDNCKDQEISVDVVPIYCMIDGADNVLMHMKWKDLRNQPDWSVTNCRTEWDWLRNLPPGCRLGILISKALLEALDHTSKTDLHERPITSYMIKSTLFWLLDGKKPEDMNPFDENFMEERHRALRQKLHFTQNNQKWMTEEDVRKFAEEGRFWAENIFDAIQFLARKHRKSFGSFFERDCIKLRKAHEVIDVLDTCYRCLERLRRDVFFAEEACTSSELGLVSVKKMKIH